jgi:hypothetical protein
LRIQVNSDKNISVDDRVISFVRDKADRALGRYEGRLMHVDFHLSDANSHKPGALDKRCVVEARPSGHQPVVVKVAARNVRSAVTGALGKMQSALEKFFGRSASGVHRGAESSRPLKRTAAARAKLAKASATKTTARKAAGTAHRKSRPARAAA